MKCFHPLPWLSTDWQQLREAHRHISSIIIGELAGQNVPYTVRVCAIPTPTTAAAAAAPPPPCINSDF